MDIWTAKAENIVNAVMGTGKTSIPQVAAILDDIHKRAMEDVAESFDKSAAKALKDADMNKGFFFQQMARDVRAMKVKKVEMR